MSTALVARPTPGTQVPAAPAAPLATPGRPGVFRRVSGLRRTSPGRLQLIMATLIVLGLLTGLVAGLTARSAAAGTDELGDRAQPLLVQAETIYSALADADTTAAQAFLAGGLEPAALTQRYNDDLDRAGRALAEAARLAPEGSAAAASVQTLAVGVPRYAALVATARADNRQGLPVGSSYLSAASGLNRDSLRPESQKLFKFAQREVGDGYVSAAGAIWIALFTVLLLVLLAALLLAQRYLSRTTHRTFNVPLVGATALTVLLALVSLVVLAGQNVHLHRADDDGSHPVASLAEARILALTERGDEALTLAARGSDDHENEFGATADKLVAALSNPWVPDEARTAHQTYLQTHQRVRATDVGGDYDGAVRLAVAPETSRNFEVVTGDIGTALEQRKEVFTDEIGAAGRGLGLLTVGGPILALLVCALAAVGIRARLEEYR